MDCGNELDTNRASPPTPRLTGLLGTLSRNSSVLSHLSTSPPPPCKSRACLQLGGICQAKTSQSAAYRTGYKEGEQKAAAPNLAGG